VGEARLLANGRRIEIEHLAPAVVEGDADGLEQVLLILLQSAASGAAWDESATRKPRFLPDLRSRPSREAARARTGRA
jgi:hypothetical protein